MITYTPSAVGIFLCGNCREDFPVKDFLLKF
nr:MAG TPA: hypothetical protein [Bacteriophage sp.]